MIVIYPLGIFYRIIMNITLIIPHWIKLEQSYHMHDIQIEHQTSSFFFFLYFLIRITIPNNRLHHLLHTLNRVRISLKFPVRTLISRTEAQCWCRRNRTRFIFIFIEPEMNRRSRPTFRVTFFSGMKWSRRQWIRRRRRKHRRGILFLGRNSCEDGVKNSRILGMLFLQRWSARAW